MGIFKKLIWSLKLDVILMLRIRGLPVTDKIYFVILKYILFIRDAFWGFSEKPGSVTVFSRKYFYNDIYGLASLQRVYCESYKLKNFITEGAVIIDIGAHIGQFNYFCNHYLKAKRIISVEPLESCFQILKLNALHPDDCVHCAVSKENKMVTIHVSETSTQHSTYIRDVAENYIDSLEIPGKKLDDLITEKYVESCDLLKIDTEGSELDVLISGQETIQRTVNVLVEMSVTRTSTGNMFLVGSYLQDHGFKLMHLMPYSENQTSVDGIFIKEDSSGHQ